MVAILVPVLSSVLPDVAQVAIAAISLAGLVIVAILALTAKGWAR